MSFSRRLPSLTLIVFWVVPVCADEPLSRAVEVARATKIPNCSMFVDGAAAEGGDGSASSPRKTISDAVAAASNGAVICVAEGTYSEQIEAGEKAFTLAGGFQSGKAFKVRDSAVHVSLAKGDGSGAFLHIGDPAPKGLNAVDGFEITGYARAVVREFYESQRFDLTNNFIHGNVCTEEAAAGAGFALNNVSGTIEGNVIQNNSCTRGGAGFLNDTTNQNAVTVKNNWIDRNSGTEPEGAHGGGLYFFGNTLKISGNLITNNSVTQWGGGLYIGAFKPGNQPTTATLSGNVYRGNRAGDSGGGFFCDDGATCHASNEVYDKNCGGNILVDGGAEGSGPTTSTFDHITSVNALTPDCSAPGDGAFVDTTEALEADLYTFTNAIFWGNAPKHDITTSCSTGCDKIKVHVATSMMQADSVTLGIKITYGAGMNAPSDPIFVAPDKGDFRLQRASPAAGKGTSGSDLGALNLSAMTSEEPEPAAAPPQAAAATPAQAPKEEAAAVPVRPPVAVSPPAANVAPAAVPAKPEESAEQEEDVSTKEAFTAAKELGTAKGWQAFLASFPEGFYADLARAYLDKLQPGANAKAAASAPAELARVDGLALGPNASLGGRRLLPDDSPWHLDISQSRVDPNSERILARAGMDKALRADFGTEWEGAPMGIQYVVVSSSQAKVPVSFTYDDESDPGPYPIPPDPPIEGGPNGTGDRHIIVLERDTLKLWELFNAFPDGNGWKADSGAIWDLKQNQVRPPRWTSADAAGLPILPGLVRYDEAVEKQAIEHALRFTVPNTRRAYISPASHWASKSFDEDLPTRALLRLPAC